MKMSFPPLLPPGRHVMDMANFKAMCVDAFPLSNRRSQLFTTLSYLIEELKFLSIPFEIWLDGSFLSHKLEPDDIDLTLVFHAYYFDKLPVHAQNFVMEMHQKKDTNGHLHIFTCIQFSDDDPRRDTSTENYWASLWLVDWQQSLKGFAIVKHGSVSCLD